MSIVLDPVARALSLSVRDLAEEKGFARIGADREGWTSYTVGTELHERVLAARLAKFQGYRRELFVRHEFGIRGWSVTVQGRIDGLMPQPDGGWIVEEFKTASVARESARSFSGNERHRRQLLIYCELCHLGGNEVRGGRLVYVDPDDDREHAIDVLRGAPPADSFIEAALASVIDELERNEAARAAKAVFAEHLPFPHDAPRPGQITLGSAIRDALETGGHLLAEAPTGSGKTAASLHAAVQHGLRTGRQVVFLTSKNLQQQIAVKALAAMNRDGRFRVAQLRAKERMCANDRVLCHEDFCRYAKDYPAKMERSALLDRLLARQSAHLPDDVFEEAKVELVCPFEVQLELARRADVVVADYNYVFDPAVALMHLRDEGLGRAILVIDEAHNLPDRARAIFSPELLETTLRGAMAKARESSVDAGSGPRRPARHPARGQRREAQLDFTSVLQEPSATAPELGPVLERLLAILETTAAVLPTANNQTAEVPPPHDAASAVWREWEPRFIGYLAWKRDRKLPPGDDSIVDLHFQLLRFVAIGRLARATPGFACVVERRPEGLRLAVLCLDPSASLAPVFRQASSAILLSATLRPFDFMRRNLGLESERLSTVVVPSPFPPENRRVLVVPSVRTNFAARDRAVPRIAGLIAEIDAAHGGNKLVLFPSYDFLRRVTDGIAAFPKLAPRLLLQSPNSTEAERTRLLASLQTPPPGGSVLFAVLGGMFAEGIDYAGDLVETVVVVSPGLPQVSFERELLRRHFEAVDASGFEHAYLHPGMTRVVQAAGRLIRSETDRGVIVLICGRFLEVPYVDRLPKDWFNHTPRELVSENPAKEIHAFFQLDADWNSLARPAAKGNPTGSDSE